MDALLRSRSYNLSLKHPAATLLDVWFSRRLHFAAKPIPFSVVGDRRGPRRATLLFFVVHWGGPTTERRLIIKQSFSRQGIFASRSKWVEQGFSPALRTASWSALAAEGSRIKGNW